MNRNKPVRQKEKQALAAALRFLRFKYNVRRQWLANQAGLSLATYEKLEQGTTGAQFVDVIAICNAMGVPLEELIQHYKRELTKIQAGEDTPADLKHCTDA